MRHGLSKSLVPFLALALLVGCEGGEQGGDDGPAAEAPAPSGGEVSKGKLIGIWDIDMLQMMKDSGQLERMPEGIDVDEMAKQMAMSVEFHEDGKLTWTTRNPRGESVEVGTWEVVSRSGAEVTIRSTDDGGGISDVTLSFVDDDRVTAATEDGPPMAMIRRQ